jgi:hypothetical protein
VPVTECLFWNPDLPREQSLVAILRSPRTGKRIAGNLRLPDKAYGKAMGLVQKYGQLLPIKINGSTGWWGFCDSADGQDAASSGMVAAN